MKYSWLQEVYEVFIGWLARKGAVGSTARWAAKNYKLYRNRHPDYTEYPDTTIFKLMIVARYEVLHDYKRENYMLSKCDSLQGLIGLVIELMKIEASLHENSMYNIIILLEVVEDELKKAKISEKTRFGRYNHLKDYYEQIFSFPEL